jgi:hypothetical protein
VSCFTSAHKWALSSLSCAPTWNWQGPGQFDCKQKEDDSNAIALKLTLNLLSNFYSILDNTAPPTCQVDEQDDDNNQKVNNINKIKEGVFDGSIPSAVTDSGATSNIGTTKDRAMKAFVATGRKSDKAFRMPNGKVEEANNMDKLQHDVRHPAKDVHIMPGIKHNSLLSIPKFVDTNYIAFFDKDKVNIYDTNKTSIVVSCGAILQGWQCKQTNLWCFPLIKEIKNNNTDTVLCDWLGWEIRSEFRGIPQLFRFWTFWTPEFSSEFYFFNRKMCSRQFWTRFFWVRNPPPPLIVPISWIGKCSRYKCQWQVASNFDILNAQTLFARTITIPLLLISTWYTQKLENLIDVQQAVGIIVEVPIQAKMDSDDDKSADF